MTKEKSEHQVFEVQRIRDLIELMKEHDLSEVDLRQDTNRIRLRRGPDHVPLMPMQQSFAPIAPPAGPAAMEPAPAKPDTATYINSPTVGTFYSRPKPDADNFVKVGDVVAPDTVVCLVEAMKMYNEITAGMSGRIVACLVDNETAVDVNKPLFKVEPS